MIGSTRPTPRTIRILLAIGFISLAIAGLSVVQLARLQASSFNGTAYPDAPAAPDFTLTGHTGAPRALADFRGRPVLLFFGFTRCPDVCPMTLAKLERVLGDAGIGPDEVSVLLVSVDPEHDTPDRLAEYVQSFGPAVTGLTGTPAAIDEVLGGYGVYAQPTSDHNGRETIAHTSVVFGIDRGGRLRVLMHPDEPDDIVESDIRALIRISE